MLHALLLAAFCVLNAQEKSSENVPVSLETLRLVRSVCSEVPDAYNACKYFSGHPDKPKIEVVFKKTGELNDAYPVDYWRPGRGPVLYRENGRLVRVELPASREILESLNQSLPKASAEEKVKRAAMLVAPLAFADLQMARLMDEREMPNYIQTDLTEKLRLIYEVGALQRIASANDSLWLQKDFRMTPMELTYVEKRLGIDGTLLNPRETYLAEKTAQRWSALRDGENIKKWPVVSLAEAKTFKESDKYLAVLRADAQSHRDWAENLAKPYGGVDAIEKTAPHYDAVQAGMEVWRESRNLQTILESSQAYWSTDRIKTFKDAANEEMKSVPNFHEAFPDRPVQAKLAIQTCVAGAMDAMDQMNCQKFDEELKRIRKFGKVHNIPEAELTAKALEKDLLVSVPHIDLIRKLSRSWKEEKDWVSLIKLMNLGVKTKGVLPILSHLIRNPNERGEPAIFIMRQIKNMGPEAIVLFKDAMNSGNSLVQYTLDSELNGLASTSDVALEIMTDLAEEHVLETNSESKFYPIMNQGKRAIPYMIRALKNPNKRISGIAVSAINQTFNYRYRNFYLAAATDDALIEATSSLALSDSNEMVDKFARFQSCWVLYQIGMANRNQIKKIVSILYKVAEKNPRDTLSLIQLQQAIPNLERMK